MSTQTTHEIACDLYEICGSTILVESDELDFYDGYMCPECYDQSEDYIWDDSFPMSLEYDEG